MSEHVDRPADSSNLLEDRYRRVLRLLPAGYRAVWEEDMVATLLESVDTGDQEDADYVAAYGRPSWSEVASVIGLAIRLRLGGPSAPPRAYAWGEGVRLFGLLAVLAYSATGTFGVVALLRYGDVYYLQGDAVGAGLVWADRVAGFLWLPAFLAVLFGRSGTARSLAAIATVPSAAFTISSTVDFIDGARFPFTSWVSLLLDLGTLLALAAFHRDAPPVRRRPWLIALPVGIAFVLGTMLPEQIAVWPVADWLGLFCVAVAVAAALHLAAPTFGRLRPSSWSLGLTLAAVAVLALRVSTLVEYGLAPGLPFRTTVLVVGAAEALLVLVVCLPVARLATNGLRALPREATANAGGTGRFR
jgi:hypothetical protein